MDKKDMEKSLEIHYYFVQLFTREEGPWDELNYKNDKATMMERPQ